MFVTEFGPVSLGAVQTTRRLGSNTYRIGRCSAVSWQVNPLPNYYCNIEIARGGLSAGHVLIKGGTAVRLAKHMGDMDSAELPLESRPLEPFRQIGGQPVTGARGNLRLKIMPMAHALWLPNRAPFERFPLLPILLSNGLSLQRRSWKPKYNSSFI